MHFPKRAAQAMLAAQEVAGGRDGRRYKYSAEGILSGGDSDTRENHYQRVHSLHPYPAAVDRGVGGALGAAGRIAVAVTARVALCCVDRLVQLPFAPARPSARSDSAIVIGCTALVAPLLCPSAGH